MEYAVFDIESTGLSKKENEVIELSIFIVNDNGEEIEKRFHSYFKPLVPMEEDNKAMAIHGITNDFLEDKPSFREKAEEIKEYFKNRIPVAYCGKTFDFGFLLAEFERNGIIFQYDCEPYDPKTLVNQLFKQLTNKKLSTVAEHLKIPIGQLHNAADDNELLKFILYKIYFKIDLNKNKEFIEYVRKCKKLTKEKNIDIDYGVEIDWGKFENFSKDYNIYFELYDYKNNIKKELKLDKDIRSDKIKVLYEEQEKNELGDKIFFELK